MAESTTAAMWAAYMAELIGCEETIWVGAGTALPDATPMGSTLTLSFPDAERREQLMLRLRGGGAGHILYAVTLVPGIAAPWACPCLLMTDDAAMARHFAAHSCAAQTQALDGVDFWRVLHMSRCDVQTIAALPEQRTLWALGADADSICRAISLGIGACEGRWGEWLTVPMRVENGVGTIVRGAAPHWLRINEDGRLWAMDPWSDHFSAQCLDTLTVYLPDTPLQTVEWTEMVLSAAIALQTPEDGAFGMGRWCEQGTKNYVNQWLHMQDIIPVLPQCSVGDPAIRSGERGAPWRLPDALRSAAGQLMQELAQSLTQNSGSLIEQLLHRLEKMLQPEKKA